MAKISDDFVILRGHVHQTGWVGFVTSNPEADQDEVPNGQLFWLVGEDWYGRTFSWSAVGLTTVVSPSWAIIVLGRDGNALVVTKSGDIEEELQANGIGPIQRGPMRNIRLIDDQVFAVGMGRQVYQWTGTDNWVRLENGLPAKRPKGKVIGFNSIDGCSTSDIYAVGWNGEIWYNDGTIWTHIDSPTNLALFDVLCVENRLIYACGQLGVILRGYGNQWDILDYEGPTELEFRSLAWFLGKLYLADGTSLHVLEGNTLVQVDFGVGEPVPSNHLHSNGKVLLSTSGKEAFTTTDGVAWTPVPV